MICQKKYFNLLKYALCITLLFSTCGLVTTTDHASERNQRVTQSTQQIISLLKNPTDEATISVTEFLRLLTGYDSQFATLYNDAKTGHEPSASEIVALLSLSATLPVELEDYLTQQSSASLIKSINTALAMELLFNLVSKKPAKTIEKWPTLVDHLTSLLAGNPDFSDFCSTLKKLKSSSRIGIMLTLGRYLPLLPKKIGAAGKETGVKEIFYRRVNW